MIAKPTIRMPAVIDPDIVKIAVQLENESAQLIEFDQKSTLTGMPKYSSSFLLSNRCLYIYFLFLSSHYS